MMRARSLAIAWLIGLTALLEDGRAVAGARSALAQGVRVSSGEATRVWFFGGVMVVFSALVAVKARRVRQEAQGLATPRALIPWPAPVRALLAGPFFAAGASLQWTLVDPWWGTLLVALAMALATHRRPQWLCRPRGAGRWLPLSDQEAFGNDPTDRGFWLDASTFAGRVGLCCALLTCGAVAYFISRTSTPRPCCRFLPPSCAAISLPMPSASHPRWRAWPESCASDPTCAWSRGEGCRTAPIVSTSHACSARRDRRWRDWSGWR